MILMIRADVLDVRLPALGSAETATPGESITLVVRADGSLAIDGQPIDEVSFIEAVRERLDAEDGARLLLAVDREAPSGALLRVADRLAAAGIGEFSVLATPEADAGGAPEDAP